MVILGLNAYHGDAAAAIVVDGRLVAAAEEERFTRVKHTAGFPAQAVRYCLEAAGVRLQDVDHIAIPRRRSARPPATAGAADRRSAASPTRARAARGRSDRRRPAPRHHGRRVHHARTPHRQARGTRAEAFVRRFDFRPASIIRKLDLLRPTYRKTINYGHFGRPGLPWEK